MKTISYEEFVKTYKPVQNPFIKAPFNGCMFETYGKEHAYVRIVNKDYVWTLIDAEGLWIIPGYRFVDRLGYFITDVRWENEDVEVQIESYKHDIQDAEE